MYFVEAMQNPNAIWVRILNDELNQIIPGHCIQNIECWSKTDFDTIINNIGSIFWKEVFTSFLKGFHIYIKKYKSRILMTNIWENPMFKYNQTQKLIPNNPSFKKNFSYAFQFIKDKLDDNNFIFYTNEEFRAMHNEFVITDVQYDRIITALKRAFQNYSIKPKHAFNDSHPVLGPSL